MCHRAPGSALTRIYACCIAWVTFWKRDICDSSAGSRIARAVYLGLWSWLNIPPALNFFGVMIGNFYGWLFLVLLWSGIVRAFHFDGLTNPLVAFILGLGLLPILLYGTKNTLGNMPTLIVTLPLIALAVITSAAVLCEKLKS
jgi:hypothetical protein